jgi:predicted NBD/HSP70 family sugar kinase
MARAPAIPPLLKDLNQRTVLDTIRAGSPISRAEISRQAGISKPTVSLALQSLLETGLVREAAARPGQPSYGAVFFEAVPEAALVLGLDLGARFLRGAICDLEGEVRARQDVEVAGADAVAVLDTFAGLRDALVESTGLPARRIDSAVVGVPGVTSANGRVRLAGPVPGLEGMDVAGELARRIGVPVAVENDVNLAAVGERWRGVARGMDDFAFLSIGTGLGAGLVLRGELQRGHHGAAGEIDFVRAGLERDIDPCAAALSAFTERLAGEDGAATTLSAPYDARDVFAAARAADALARRVVDEEARRIALHILPIASVADVALVVIGGGIGANGDLLLQPVRALLADWLPYPPRVEISSLGDGAVLTGALAVGLRAARDNVFVNRHRVAAG